MVLIKKRWFIGNKSVGCQSLLDLTGDDIFGNKRLYDHFKTETELNQRGGFRMDKKNSNSIISLPDEDVEKYAGMFVAFKDFSSRDILAANASAMTLYSELDQLGIKDAVIFFVYAKHTSLVSSIF